MIVRHACKEDCAAIGEIYNHAVLHTAAIWNDKTVDTDNRIAWFEARTLAGYPVLVSEEDGVITGYASFGDWRAFDGFRHTVEHSVYVHPDHQGKGIGRRLLSYVAGQACAKGYTSLTLTTFRDVPWNAPWYARLGFEMLADETLPAKLRQKREEEAAHGLAYESRCAMRLMLR